MENRAHLSAGFRDIAKFIDQTDGGMHVRDLERVISSEVHARGLIFNRPDNMTTLTAMFYDRMESAFVECVKAMRHGQNPADMLAAFEKADFAQTSYASARATDEGSSRVA